MELSSGIFITKKPQEFISELKKAVTVEKLTIIDSGDKEFLIEQASEAISKAFITTEMVEFITLVSPKFSIISQNKLLKIIEEPPPNKEFILITKSKASLLPTITSRLPITSLDKNNLNLSIMLDIENLDLEEVYRFIQKNSHISSIECKELIETIAINIIKSRKYNINSSLLKMFSNSIEALNLGSQPLFILNGILFKLLSLKKEITE